MPETKKSITISIKTGPIRFQDGPLPGVEHEHEFGNGIYVQEYSVPSKTTAFYELTLRKDVSDENQADAVNLELEETLKCLCYAWYWAGGGRMRFDKLKVVRQPLFETNVGSIKEEFLAEKGLKTVNARMAMSVDFCQIVKEYPLGTAIRICRVCQRDQHLFDLLRYYYEAYSNNLSWYSDLYKIVDVLKKRFREEKRAMSILKRDYNELGCFKKILDNFNLRHASDIGKETAYVPPQKKAKVFSIAESWIKAYLDYVNLVK